MFGILTNDTNNTIPLDNFTFIADGFYACSNFHSLISYRL